MSAFYGRLNVRSRIHHFRAVFVDDCLIAETGLVRWCLTTVFLFHTVTSKIAECDRIRRKSVLVFPCVSAKLIF